jgi:photosynthetic reaction center cytochrome c subunit
MSFSLKVLLAVAAVFVGALAFTFEHPPLTSQQYGYRGTGMEHVVTKKHVAKIALANTIPTPIDPAPATGKKASEVYKNVKVLGDLSEEQFNRVMAAITEWVSPEQGCAYCHNAQNLADDSMYTKVVARRMLQMTKHINTNFKTHVAATGVTCYTCHRGNPVPKEIWFTQPERTRPGGMLGNNMGQNRPVSSVAYASLPYDPFSSFLADKQTIRVQGLTALPTDHVASIASTEKTYGLMMHMSQSLGVNCTACHNTRSFYKWDSSTPQRVTAWHGIQMVRDLNTAYLNPLQGTFPANRLGPLGDAPKANCATCHQGVNKPLSGVSMLKDYQELNAVK